MIHTQTSIVHTETTNRVDKHASHVFRSYLTHPLSISQSGHPPSLVTHHSALSQEPQPREVNSPSPSSPIPSFLEQTICAPDRASPPFGSGSLGWVGVVGCIMSCWSLCSLYSHLFLRLRMHATVSHTFFYAQSHLCTRAKLKNMCGRCSDGCESRMMPRNDS